MKKPNYNKVCDNYRKIVWRAFLREQGIPILSEGAETNGVEQTE